MRQPVCNEPRLRVLYHYLALLPIKQQHQYDFYEALLESTEKREEAEKQNEDS